MRNTRFQDFCHCLVGWESKVKHGSVCLSFNSMAQQIPLGAVTIDINIFELVTLEALLEAYGIHQVPPSSFVTLPSSQKTLY